MKFYDRQDAGERLAEALHITDAQNAVVLALPRGGIPLGLVVAEKHRLPFDILLSKKIGHPHHSEYAVGAVSEHGEPILNTSVTDLLEPDWISSEVIRLRKEMDRRRKSYTQVLDEQTITERTVIIVDDGVATGLTMKAAIESIKENKAEAIIVAVPVLPRDTYEELMKSVDQVVAVDIPDLFLGAVGAYYREFPQVDDDEVLKMLESFKNR